MPDIRDPNTVQALARGYIENNRDKSKGALFAGYTRNTAYSGRCTIFYDRDDVKQAIRRREDKLAAKSDTTVETVHTLYEIAYNDAQTLKQPSSCLPTGLPAT